MRISDWSSDVCSSDLHHMVGEDAPESRVRNRRRAYIARRRIGVRQVGEGGSGHAKTPLLCWFQERASCQRAARRATVATMPDENFLSQVPAASALFLREEEVELGLTSGRARVF